MKIKCKNIVPISRYLNALSIYLSIYLSLFANIGKKNNLEVHLTLRISVSDSFSHLVLSNKQWILLNLAQTVAIGEL